MARSDADTPEGGVYEMHYRAARAAVDTRGARTSAAGGRRRAAADFQLWRRVDPIPDDTPDGGGVVFPVVRGLTSLSIDVFDGDSWAAAWDSDEDGYPHAVRIQVTAMSESGDRVGLVSSSIVATAEPVAVATSVELLLSSSSFCSTSSSSMTLMPMSESVAMVSSICSEVTSCEGSTALSSSIVT